MKKTLNIYTFPKLLLIALGCALFVIFPEVTWIPWELSKISETEKFGYLAFFVFRYVYYTGFVFLLLQLNLKKTTNSSFVTRFGRNILISIVGYAIYAIISFIIYSKVKHLGSLILFEFLIMCFIGTIVGHIAKLYIQQRNIDRELEQLKLENLQSRCDALANQINPHFFFNSLNGLTSLIRKQNMDNTLTYVNKLSDVFRYILQSDRKGLVTLGEELEFVDAFRHLMEVRFANKLEYKISVNDEVLSNEIPVLSILPLLDNIVVHNMIDSDHKMLINIYYNDNDELVVTNPIYPKLSPPTTNGTGLNNLENRFTLLMNKQVRVENDGTTFYVYLPLK